jgi:hypothetical protein
VTQTITDTPSPTSTTRPAKRFYPAPEITELDARDSPQTTSGLLVATLLHNSKLDLLARGLESMGVLVKRGPTVTNTISVTQFSTTSYTYTSTITSWYTVSAIAYTTSFVWSTSYINAGATVTLTVSTTTHITASVPTSSPTDPPATTASQLSPGATAGVAVGSTAAAFVVFAVPLFIWWRRKKDRGEKDKDGSATITSSGFDGASPTSNAAFISTYEGYPPITNPEQMQYQAYHPTSSPHEGYGPHEVYGAQTSWTGSYPGGSVSTGPMAAGGFSHGFDHHRDSGTLSGSGSPGPPPVEIGSGYMDGGTSRELYHERYMNDLNLPEAVGRQTGPPGGVLTPDEFRHATHHEDMGRGQ